MKIHALFFTSVALTSTGAFGQKIDTEQIPDLPIRSVPSGAPPQGVASRQGWSISLGGGISYAPSYEGSANNRRRFLPLLEASYNNGKLFVSPTRGIGYNFSDSRDMQYGLRLALEHGRKQNVDARLFGMGDVSRTADLGAFINWRFAPGYLSSALSASSHGSHFELGGGINVPLSAADRLRLGANLNWGDSQYNQTYFGVTSAQAAASGNTLTTYNASAGIKDYALTANWAHTFSKEWFSSTGLSHKRLTGSAQSSPLTMRRTTNSFNFLIGYRF